MRNLLSLTLLTVSLGLILLLAGTAGAVVQDTLRPVDNIYANGNEWEDYPAPTYRWAKIDEEVSDDDNTYLHEVMDNEGYVYETGDWSGDGDPDSVEACYLLRKAEDFNSFTVAIGRAAAPEAIFQWCGTPDTVDVGGVFDQNWYLKSIMMTQDPCTDAAWTTASLNTHSYGYGIRYARADTRAIGRYTQGYIVVYSTEAAEGQVIIISVADFHRPPRAYLDWREQ